MSSQTIAVQLRLQAVTAEDLERLGIDLKGDLEVLGATVQHVAKPTPPGSKAIGSVDWGQLLLSLAASGGVLTALVGLIQARLGRDRKATIEIDGDKLELSGLDAAEQKQLILAWLDRHGNRSRRG